MDAEKSQLRQDYNERRKALGADLRSRYDEAIRNRLAMLPEFRSCTCVAAFVRWGAEPDLLPVCRGKRLFLPRYATGESEYELVEISDLRNDLRPGKYGIPEPRPELPAADRDFVEHELFFLVPAVACDLNGTRLGRGGGFYDRLLDKVVRAPAAVIYSCQLATGLPSEPHDHPMGWVVTENNIYNCPKR